MPPARNSSLAELVAGFRPRPTAALLLSFEASLPFFERVILPALSGGDLHDVDIVVDWRDYAESTFDFGGVRKAGIYYRVHPARLHQSSFAFHPKLLVLTCETAAHIIVTSANATPSGWQRNLEIVDAFSVENGAAQNYEAATQIAEFLRTLPVALAQPSRELLDALTRTTQALGDLSPGSSLSTGAPSEPRVLHSVSESLLAQVERIIPEPDVDRITAVSPYFDATNSALRLFAKRYQRATFRVIKEGMVTNDFNGPSFAALGKRHSLQSFSWKEGAGRALHAKVVLFEGPRHAWLVCGSANMSGPGWLQSPHCGNIEVVTIRHGSGASRSAALAAVGVDEMWSGLATRDIDALSQVFELKEQDPIEDDIKHLVVDEAVEDGNVIRILWTGPFDAKGAQSEIRITLRVEDREVREHAIALHIDEKWSATLSTESEAVARVLNDELAVVVHVQQWNTDGDVALGSAWLQRSVLLALPQSVRDRRSILLSLLSNEATPSDMYGGLLALVSLAQADSPALDLVDDEELQDSTQNRVGVVHGRTRPLSSASGRHETAVRSLRRVLLATLRGSGRHNRWGSGRNNSMRQADLTQDDTAEEMSDDDVVDTDIGDELIVGTLSTDHARNMEWMEACDTVEEVVRRACLRSGTDAETGRAIGLLVYCADLLVQMEWTGRTPDDSSVLKRIQRARRFVWAHGWSIHGWENGQVSSYLAGKVDRDAVAAAERALSQPSIVARVLVSAAAAARMDGYDNIADVAMVMRAITGIYALEPTDDFQRCLELQLERFSSSSASGCRAHELADVITHTTLHELPGWPNVERWLPLRRLMNGDISVDAALQSLPSSVVKQLDRVLRNRTIDQALTSVFAVDDDLYCRACDTRLSTSHAQSMGERQHQLSTCEECHRLLMPLDLSTGLAQILISFERTFAS